MQLFSIDQIQGDQVTPGYSKKLKLEFLQAHPTLVVDTQHFPCSFVDRLIDNTALVTEVSGVLFGGENESALRLMGGNQPTLEFSVYTSTHRLTPVATVSSTKITINIPAGAVCYSKDFIRQNVFLHLTDASQSASIKRS